MRTSLSGRGVLRRLRGSDDSGSVLVMVIGSMLVLSMLALTALSFTLRSTKFSRYDQDYSTALSASQSGIEDIISRLNRDDSYGLSPDCDNDAWKGPMPASSNICGWTPTTTPGWAPVEPGQTGKNGAGTTSRSLTTVGSDTYQLTVTGRANNVYRTTEGTVKVGTSLDYVYYTDFEDADPANTLLSLYSPVGAKNDECGKSGAGTAWYWHVMPGRAGARNTDTNCQEIRFASGDVLDGEVFSNDTIWATHNDTTKSKPRFMKQVWTADEKCKGATTDSTTWVPKCLRTFPSGDTSMVSSATFDVKPAYHVPLYLDDSSAKLASKPGCKYFGAVRVRFNTPASGAGTMTVWNATTVNGGMSPVATPNKAGVTPGCGSLADLNSAAGATVTVPSGMVFYAANSPAPSRQCYAGEIGGPTTATKLPFGTFNASVPAVPGSTSTYTADKVMLAASKRCNQGNIYVEGVFKGQLTMAAAQSIIVTGDVVMAGGTVSGPDVLGLVATNSVEIFHPTVGTVKSRQKCATLKDDGSDCKTLAASGYEWSNTTTAGTDSDVSGWPTRYKEPGASVYTPTTGIQIAAAIQTLQHSMLVQSYDSGCFKGTLYVKGSIAQRWRGIVGVPDTGCATTTKYHGYLKDYHYDSRLVTIPVPEFPKWANSVYTLRASGEIRTPAAVKK